LRGHLTSPRTLDEVIVSVPEGAVDNRVGCRGPYVVFPLRGRAPDV
jgi:hypothetical protein